MRIFVAEYLSGLEPGALDAALLAQGVAMRDAVLSDLLVAEPHLTLHCAVSPQAPLPEGLAGVQPLPCPAGESPVDFVRRHALAHDVVWVIAPESGDLLGQLADAVPPSRWLGCDATSIRIASSKSKTTALLHAQGVLTPRAFENDASVRAWVVKPDDGVGASEARRHGTRAAAEADRSQRPSAVLEPWVDGPAMSLTLLCEGGRAELLSVNRQSVDVDADGWLIEQGVSPLDVPADAALQRLAQQVAQAMPGLFGLVGIDYVANPAHGPVLIEVNPRVTSAVVGLAQRAPGRLARATLDLWATRAGSPPAR